MILYLLAILVIVSLAVWVNVMVYERGKTMEIEDMLFRLIEIRKTKNIADQNEIFFKSLSTDELARLSGFCMVVSEYADKIAVEKILEGGK